MPSLYDTKSWRDFRAHARASECFLANVAGQCRGALHVHHVDPLSEGGPAFPDEGGVITLCAAHHRMIDSFLKRREGWRRCPHHHRSREAREQCEARLNRAASRAA